MITVVKIMNKVVKKRKILIVMKTRADVDYNVTVMKVRKM